MNAQSLLEAEPNPRTSGTGGVKSFRTGALPDRSITLSCVLLPVALKPMAPLEGHTLPIEPPERVSGCRRRAASDSIDAKLEGHGRGRGARPEPFALSFEILDGRQCGEVTLYDCL